MDTVLLVDDEPQILKSQRELLALHGFSRIMEAETAAEARARFESSDVALVLLDLTLKQESGLALLEWIRESSPDTAVIVVTAASDISMAVRCMRAGAYDFLVKGNDAGRLPAAVGNALSHRQSRMENSRLRTALVRSTPAHPEVFDDFVSESPAIRHIFVYLEAVAGTPDPMLITGETGVGKELVARAIHTASGRDGPFVAVNLGGLDDHTIFDTLFGHVKGAFTGADAAREGLVRRAAAGTLFLDEFAEISTEAQVKLLRLLDSGEFMALGGDRTLTSTARMIFATNRDLKSDMGSGRLRQDLFFRISNHWVTIPPLRDRPEDIEPLLRHLMKRHARRLAREAAPVSEDTIEALRSLPLPGNVRELEQYVINALVHGTWGLDPRGRREILGARGTGRGSEPGLETESGNGGAAVVFGTELPTPADAIAALLREADRRYPNNRAKAAAAVGLSPQAFANRWKRISERAVSSG